MLVCYWNNFCWYSRHSFNICCEQEERKDFPESRRAVEETQRIEGRSKAAKKEEEV